MKYSAQIKQLDGCVRLLGRTVWSGNSLALDWSGSGFEMNVCCDRLIIDFEPYSNFQPAYLKVSCGFFSAKYAISTGTERIIIENVGGCECRLSLLRITEASAQLKIRTLHLEGENVSVGKAPKAPEKRIEFYGDSITCGYGNLASPDRGEFNTYEEDVTEAYAYKTAKLLGMDARYVCISGEGVVKNCAGERGCPVPEFFHYASRVTREPVDFSLWTPDVAVINAGTNDWGGRVSADEFYSGARMFIDDIRSAYPKTELIWFYGMMGLPYDDVLSRVVSDCGDSHLHYLPIRPIYEFEGETGANGHPNVKGHSRAASQLSEFIKALGVLESAIPEVK